MPDEFVGAAVLGSDDRFARRPAFQDADAEGFVAAGQADHVAGLVQINQVIDPLW